MVLGHRSARRRGMVMGAAMASSRSRKQQAAAPAPAAQAAPAPSAPADTTVEQIKQLAELRDQGILTEEEFSSKKKKLLGI